jgi:hypothetical protein
MTITINSPQELKEFAKGVSKHTKISATKLLHAIALSKGYSHVRALFNALEASEIDMPSVKIVCQQCSFDLRLDGYCTNEMCRHNDWPQEITEQQFDLLNDGSLDHPLYNSVVALKRIPITADVHSDCRKFENDIDVSEYFYDALTNGTLNTVLSDLDDCDFDGDTATDEIAQYFDKTTTGYLFEITNSNNGFECIVEKNEVLEWLNRYAPSFVKDGKLLLLQKDIISDLPLTQKVVDEQKVIVVLSLLPKIAFEDLSESDQELDSTYEMSLSVEASISNYANIAKDYFAVNYPIKNLGDFDIIVKFLGEDLQEDLNHETYTMEHLVLSVQTYGLLNDEVVTNFV